MPKKVEHWTNEPTRIFADSLRSNVPAYRDIQQLADDHGKLLDFLKARKEGLKEHSQGGLPGAIYLAAVQSIDVVQAADEFAHEPVLDYSQRVRSWRDRISRSQSAAANRTGRV